MRKHVEELAYEKGYRVTEGGVLIGLRGAPIYATKTTKGKRAKISFYYGSSRFTVMVHRLQAYQKYGAGLYGKGLEVRHKNDCYSDNSRKNIILGTHLENIYDTPQERRRQKALAGAMARRSLSEEKVRQLRHDRARGMKYNDLMVKYGIAKGTVSLIVNRKTYSGV